MGSTAPGGQRVPVDNRRRDDVASSPPAEATDVPDRDGWLNVQFESLYPEIKRVARARLAQSGGKLRSLNTTALVHEGFLRMAEQRGLQGESRGQFFAYVGRVLRSVVIDHVRAESADKRGGASPVMLTLSAAEQVPAVLSDATDVIALDRALRQMQDVAPPLYQLLEMLIFTGISVDEVAALRQVTRRTVSRDLLKARTLLAELMADRAVIAD